MWTFLLLPGEEADEEEEEEEEETYRQQPDVNTLKPTPLIHRPAFGSSTPTMRRWRERKHRHPSSDRVYGWVMMEREE